MKTIHIVLLAWAVILVAHLTRPHSLIGQTGVLLAGTSIFALAIAHAVTAHTTRREA